MPYNFIKARNALAIDTQEYATAAEIRFTTFTSCIGVIARKGTMLTAVHLVQAGTSKYYPDPTAKYAEYFSPNNASQVINVIVGKPFDEIKIIGHVSSWNNVRNQAHAGFQKLLAEAGIQEPRDGVSLDEIPQLGSFGEGVYGAKIGTDGKIEITYPPFD